MGDSETDWSWTIADIRMKHTGFYKVENHNMSIIFILIVYGEFLFQLFYFLITTDTILIHILFCFFTVCSVVVWFIWNVNVKLFIFINIHLFKTLKNPVSFCSPCVWWCRWSDVSVSDEGRFSDFKLWSYWNNRWWSYLVVVWEQWWSVTK